MAVSSAQITVNTTATLLATGVGRTQVFLSPQSGWTVYLGPSGVTTGTGFLPASFPGFLILTDGETLYGIMGSGSQSVHVLTVN